MSSSKIIFSQGLYSDIETGDKDHSSFLLRDLTSAGCRQTFTVVFSKISCCVLITFVVPFTGFCQAFQILFSFLLTFA